MGQCPFAVGNIDHVVLRSARAPDLISFYRDVLDCQLERELPDIGLYQLRAGTSLIDVIPVDSELGRKGGAAPGGEARNVDHICLRVAPFDESLIRAHLAEFGIEAPELSTRYGADGFGPSLYIADPDGNTVELKGPPHETN
jgi:glyoxylase I family protein